MKKTKKMYLKDRNTPVYLCESMKNGIARYGLLSQDKENNLVTYQYIGRSLSKDEHAELKELGYATYSTTCIFDSAIPQSLQNEIIKETESIDSFDVRGKSYCTFPLYIHICDFDSFVHFCFT